MPIQWKNIAEATEMAKAARALSGANAKLIDEIDSVEVGGYPTSILCFANYENEDTIIQKQYVTYMKDSHIVIYFNENYNSRDEEKAQKIGDKIIATIKLKKVKNPLDNDSIMRQAVKSAMDNKEISDETIKKGNEIIKNP
jgi:elongation factor P--beta-lysine ligase